MLSLLLVVCYVIITKIVSTVSWCSLECWLGFVWFTVTVPESSCEWGIFIFTLYMVGNMC